MTVCVSGGFDQIHGGHIDYIKDAAKYGNVIVILNSDEWLVRKKGYFILPWKERAKILAELRDVRAVVGVKDHDGSVCEALRRLKPRYFANGGDRTEENTLELDVCKELGIKPLFGIGGNKITSSSELANRIAFFTLQNVMKGIAPDE